MQNSLVPESDLPVSNLVPEHDIPTDYETPEQQFKTGAEGLAKGIAGPLATLAETKVFGVKPEDIEGRANANPILHGASEAAGLVGGSLIPGVGEYTLGSKIAKAGEAASGLIHGAEAARAAARAASEMALIQASNETSKWLEHDPNQSIQSAIANIGLSAALGGVGGAIFSKAGQALRSLGDKPEEVVGGIKQGLDPFTKEPIEYAPKMGGERANFDPFTKKPIEPKEAIAPEAPISPKVKTSDIGDRIAQAIKNHAAEGGLDIAGGGIGAAIGHATGIPGAGWIGAYLGKEHLAPILKSIIPALGQRIMGMEVSGPGFMSAINAAEQALKGRILLEKVSNSIFQSDITIPLPSKEDKKQLDIKVRALQNNPAGAQAIMNQDLSHYMPEHAMSLGQTIGNAVQYLNTQRPQEEKQSPLDSKPVPNKIQKASYDRALNIAQQPLSIVNNIKSGNLTSVDIKHLANIYPALYEQMKSSLMSSMVNHLSKNKEIPYKTRLGLSLFMGQPLDSSMKPMSIQASQPAPQQIPQGAQGAQNVKHSTTGLNKLAQMDATPMQARQAHKIAKG